jgi:endonuclease III
MTKKERYIGIIEWFKENRPNASSELKFTNPYELIVAVVLSAQCTDKRVNIVTPALFEKYPTPQSLSESSFEELFPYIKSISYPNNKTKHLLGLSKKLVEDFGGQIPESIEELQSLPGVGRKTANVVSSIAYKKQVIAVDTHVFRISKRLGLSNGKTVESVEKELTKNIPEEYRAISHHWLILHGRYVCTARNPKCKECELKKWCKYYSSL